MKISIKNRKSEPIGLKHSMFVLIGMMRSGSYLLRRLTSLRDVRWHGERFNRSLIGFPHDYLKQHAGHACGDREAGSKNEMMLPHKFASGYEGSG